MKTFHFTRILSLIVFSALNTIDLLAESGGLLQNGDFESAQCAPWRLDSNSKGIAIDAEFAHCGKKSLKLIAGTETRSIRSGVILTDLNTVYTVSLWLKTRDINARDGFSVKVFQKNDRVGWSSWYPTTANSKPVETRQVKAGGTQDWTRYQFSFVPDATAQFIEIVLQMDANIQGTAWVDDVSLDCVSTRIAQSDFTGDWHNVKKWGDQVRFVERPGAVDCLDVQLPDGQYTLCLSQLGDRHLDIAVAIDGALLGTGDGTPATGWRKIGKTRLKAGPHRITLTSQDPHGLKSQAAYAGLTISTQDDTPLPDFNSRFQVSLESLPVTLYPAKETDPRLIFVFSSLLIDVNYPDAGACGFPSSGGSLLADIAHRYKIPVTWMVSNESTPKIHGQLSQWHQQYGDDIASLNWQDFRPIKKLLPWASTTVAAAGGGRNVPQMEDCGVQGAWGWCWEQIEIDNISDKGCPWAPFYVSRHNPKAPANYSGKVIAFDWSLRDLNKSLHIHSGEACRFSSDVDEPHRGKILYGRAIEYWKQYLDEYLRNTDWNEVVPFVMQQESHEMEWSFAWRPPNSKDATKANQKQVTLNAQALDEFFKYAKSKRVTFMTQPEFIQFYRQKFPAKTPPFYMLFRDIPTQQPVSYTCPGAPIHPGPYPLTFLYTDSDCQLAFEAGEPTPKMVYNYQRQNELPKKGNYPVENQIPRINEFTKIIEPEGEVWTISLTNPNPYDFPMGITEWGNHAGQKLRRPVAEILEYKPIGEALSFIRLNLKANSTLKFRLEFQAPPASARLTPVPIQQVTVDDAFWSPRLKAWREVTIPDCLAKFEKDGTLLNFDRVRDGQLKEKHGGAPWFDGLIYEMIRACSDYLAAQRDPVLERRLDGYIERIAAAQAKDPDGYLNTYTQMVEPAHHWGLNGGNDPYQHDIYNAGAAVEAGVHYYRATGKVSLLKLATRLANNMCDVIGPQPKANMIPGHSGPEEALVRLFELFREQPELKRIMGFPVEEQRYLKLAEFFIEARGHYEGRKPFNAYGQDHKPVFEQQTIEGHAVRATLMGTGLAALACANDRIEYEQASKRLWDNMTGRRMYVTGGVGVRAQDEAFARDYDLPNKTYAETCAAVGSGFFSRNLNLLTGNAACIDELERALYNNVLAGVSVKGDTYFYTNPLEGNKKRERWSWSGCPCCPPMFLKITGAMPGYIYAKDSSGIYVNLFIGSRVETQLPGGKVALRQTTGYPWQGDIRIAVEPENPGEFDLNVRIPAWCQGASTPNDLYQIIGRPTEGAARLKINGQVIEHPEMVRGYARLHREWKAGDVIELSMDMPVRRVEAHALKADVGRVALMRGPIVYCVESCDNGDHIRSIFVPPNAEFSTEHREGLFGGVTVLRGKVAALQGTGNDGLEPLSMEMTAIPYAFNTNRGPVEMAVWLPETAALAEPPFTIASHAHPSASFACPSDPVKAVNDQIIPAHSEDWNVPRFTWWNHRGTKEWLQYDFERPQKVSSADIFWWGRVQKDCRVPESWRLLYKAGADWKAVEGASEYGTKPDQFNHVNFTPVTTTALRVEVQLQPNFSAGVLEWKVQ